MYNVIIKKQARKKLLGINKQDKIKLTEKIVMLGANPDNQQLDVKKLTGQPGYRLRVGDWRVIFLRDDEIMVIAVEKIKSRGDVYK